MHNPATWTGLSPRRDTFPHCHTNTKRYAGSVLSYKLRYIAGFWLVEMAISPNPKPTIYRNLYDDTGSVDG